MAELMNGKGPHSYARHPSKNPHRNRETLPPDPPTMRHEADMKATVELTPQKQQNLFLKLTNHYKSYEDPLTASFFTIPYTGTVRSNALPLSF
jgi:hypothetical protein